ncbi:MAG: HEAT repeat domain-containing protein [Roseibacillus sp.]|nr:HEAT repeat domain-containing protein [Roseibacillus sp.]
MKTPRTFLWCAALACSLAESSNGELVAAKGVAVTPFATEDQLSNPASIDVDDRGRVWVGEAINYRKKDRKEGDRILILEDSNGDGRSDKTKVFYQDPDIDGVHGVCVLGNKVIVSAPDRILLLTDDDGDDKAEAKELLFRGKVLHPVQGQHDHAIHAVMFGPDGRLYFNFGNFNAGLWRADGTLVKDVFGNPVDNSRKPYQEGMVIRCEMDGSQVEVLGYNFRNNWEVTVDSFGSMWQSDNDNGSSSCRVNFVMEYGNYGYREEMTGLGYQSKRTNMEATMQRRMWHQNDPGVVPNLLITGGGAPTGILVYEGNLLPKPFRDQMIHAEPGRNVVWAFPTKQAGAGYTARITNLVHSQGDRNYRPSDVSVAPDGSLIIADWFDPVDCCHRTINDAGRIFRVAPPGHAYVVPDFDFKTPAGAAKALRNPNLSVRYKAWTALHAMQEKARPALRKMATDENPRFRARALWALAAIKDGAQEAIEVALQDEDANLRALALRIARRHGMAIEPLVRRMVRDESTLVRRECAVSLHRVATSEAAGLWAELALQHDGRDRWYLEALGIGEKGNKTACFNAWLKKVGDDWKAPAGRDIVWRSRAPEAAGLLAKLVLDPKVPESEHPRLMRAFDFHSGKAREDALAILLLDLDAPTEPKTEGRR